MPLVILSSCTVQVYYNPGYQSSLLCMTCFSFPSPSAAAASVYWDVVAAASMLCHACAHGDLPSDYQINAL